MALSPNPLLYTFPTAVRNREYGPELYHLLNYYPNATRVTGGNPWFAFVHGGGFGSGDKTSLLEGATRNHLWAAYVLDSASYGTTAYFDFFGIGFGCHSHSGTVAGSYERVIDGGTLGPISFPKYAPNWVDDVQRAVQWIKKNISGINPDRGILFGNSAGSEIAVAAAFGPQRHRAPGEPTSKVRGVLSYMMPIDADPWQSDLFSVVGELGFQTSSNANTRADIERALLVPDASGAYPRGSAKNALAKRFSPVDVVQRGDKTVRLRSMYRTVAADTTTVPITTYGSEIPPYGPHDSVQAATLQAVCDSSNVDHTYAFVTGATQSDEEAIFTDQYAWSVETVA